MVNRKKFFKKQIANRFRPDTLSERRIVGNNKIRSIGLNQCKEFSE